MLNVLVVDMVIVFVCKMKMVVEEVTIAVVLFVDKEAMVVDQMMFQEKLVRGVLNNMMVCVETNFDNQMSYGYNVNLYSDLKSSASIINQFQYIDF